MKEENQNGGGKSLGDIGLGEGWLTEKGRRFRQTPRKEKIFAE